MTLDEFQEKLDLNKENSSIHNQIEEMLELFTDLANLKYISFYRYNYEYNEFFHKFSIDCDGEKVELPKESGGYKIHLEKDGIVYGYIQIYERLKSSSILKKLIKKIIKYLEHQRELEKKLLGSDVSFNIYLIHDETLDMFASNLKNGLEGLFNVDVILDNSIDPHSKDIRSKESKHIIIYLIEGKSAIEQSEDIVRSLNELIIVIGPNDHYLSMYCGKLGIQNYIPITEFKAEEIKNIIVNTRNNLINKNREGNKIIAMSGISGGIGTTSIAMNSSSLLASKMPEKNILYIDLSTTKAISNLFLGENPLPDKTIIDLINSSEFHLENNMQNGLVKVSENFYSVTGIQKHIDKEYLEQGVFIEKLLEYIYAASDYFNFIILDIGIADASNLKTTIYDVVNEIWLVTEMNLPHISKVKTFYSLMKRAGLKEKISFIVNRYDSQNSISVSDVTSILNMTSGEKIHFDDYKIPNDYKTLGKCWNYCDLATEVDSDSPFIKRLEKILQIKGFYQKNGKEKKSIFSSLFGKSKK